MTIKKELTAMKKETTSIVQKLEKLLMAVDKSESKASKAPKGKAVKAIPAKKTSKAPAKKKATVTDTDKVLNIIKRSKKGVDAATLMKKTGFNDKKIRNMLFRANKEGKIQKAGRGVYVGM